MLNDPRRVVILCALLSASFAVLTIAVKQFALIWFGAAVLACVVALAFAGGAAARSTSTPMRTRALIIGSSALLVALGIFLGTLIGRP
jgi:hypothetical protein